MSKRPTLKETIAANEKALRGLCFAAGKPIPPGFEERAVEPVKQRAAPVKSDIPLEHEEQKNFVKWFRQQYRGVRIFAVPNAAMRDYKLAAYLVAEGLTAGVPDLIVVEWKLCIEMKRIKGSTISDEQLSWKEYLHNIGWTHYFGYGCMDAINKVKEFRKGEDWI